MSLTHDPASAAGATGAAVRLAHPAPAAGPRLPDEQDLETVVDRQRRTIEDLQRLLDAIPNPVFYKDPDGRYQGCNRAFEAFLGQPRHRIIERTAAEIAPGDLAAVYHRKDLELMAAGGNQRYEGQVESADGTRRDVVFNKAVVADGTGRPAGLVGAIEDVTAAREMRRALEASEQRLKAVFGAVQCGVYILDAETRRVVDANRYVTLTLGYPQRELIGRPCSTLFCDCRPEICPVMQGLEVPLRNVEKTFRNRSGEDVPVLVSLQPVRIAGRLHYVNSFVDIGHLRQKEHRMHRQKRSLEALHDTAVAIVDHLDPQDLMREIVRRACSLAETENGFLYLRQSEAAGMRMLTARGAAKRLEGRTIGKGEGLCGVAWQQRATTRIEDYSRWSGRLTDTATEDFKAALGVPIIDEGRVIGVLGLLHTDARRTFDDETVAITESLVRLAVVALGNARLYSEIEGARRQAEQTAVNLARSAAEMRKLQRAVEQSPVSIVITDPQGRIEYVNPKFCEVTGYRPDEAVGQNPRILKSGRQDAAVYRELWRTITAGSMWSGTFCNRRKDGTLFWEEAHIGPVRDEAGRIEHFIALKQDITTRKNLEARLMQSEKLSAIGQLAAGVAHEINNPSGFVLSNLKTLAGYAGDMATLLAAYRELAGRVDTAAAAAVREAEARLDAEFLLQDIVELVGESCEGMERIRKIVADLKNFAHPGEGARVPADLNAGLASTLNVVWNELKYKARVVKDLGDLPPVICNPQEINQVFMNLLVNAAQAISGQGEIRIATRCAGDRAEVVIADTGGGIPPDQIGRVFDPFYTTKPVGQGTGLGLNIAHNIVTHHGGTIEVESEVGRGTVFTIRLPAKAANDGDTATGEGEREEGKDSKGGAHG